MSALVVTRGGECSACVTEDVVLYLCSGGGAPARAGGMAPRRY